MSPPDPKPDPTLQAEQAQADQQRLAQMRSSLGDVNLNFSRLFGTSSLMTTGSALAGVSPVTGMGSLVSFN
jgi:hypothetical protein